MSNCITLNTASITSVDAIKSVVPISQGPKGDKGDRGERGPQGLPGDARINDKAVSGVETWSSKKIVDYVQSNDTTWTPKTIEGDGKVDHTNNGYIKGLEIEGRTLKNVLGVKFESKSEFLNLNRLAEIEDRALKITILEVGTYNFEIGTRLLKTDAKYTLIYEILENTLVGDYKLYFYGGTGAVTANQMKGDFFINNSKGNATKGVHKHLATTKPNFEGITTSLRSFLIGATGGTIKLRYYLLEGDYTQKDVPNFIEGVQGVGLKTEKGYKIGVKTHGKNLFNINAKYTNDKRAPFKLIKNGFEITRTSSDSYQKVIFELDTKYKNGDYYFSFIEEGRGLLKIGFMNGTKEITRIAGSKKVSISEEFNKIAFYVESIGVENKVIAKNIQLEEGTHATKYEPYKESTQEVIIQQQLNTGDKLVFENGEYVIKTSTGQTLKTNINNEMLPATFDGLTYVTQDTGVKGTLKGQFPINSQAVITSLENKNKELEERLGQQEEMLTTLYSFYRGTLEE